MKWLDLLKRFGKVECGEYQGVLDLEWVEEDAAGEFIEEPDEVRLTLCDGDGEGAIIARCNDTNYGVSVELLNVSNEKVYATFRKEELRAFAEALVEMCDMGKEKTNA